MKEFVYCATATHCAQFVVWEQQWKLASFLLLTCGVNRHRKRNVSA